MFSDPWSASDFRESLAVGVPFFVAEEDGAVAGYVIAQYAADQGEILNLGVASPYRGRGLGRSLVERALAELAAQGVTSVFLEVRDSNQAARRLYERLGFREVGRRVSYYEQPREDAVLLRTAISAAGRSA